MTVSNKEGGHFWSPTIHSAVFDEGVAGNPDQLGAVNAQTGLAVVVERGPNGYFEMLFTLTALVLTVTDAGAGGSSASSKIWDFGKGLLEPMGSYQDYTAFAEGAALTGAAGDAAFVMGVGSVAANAGDGALTGTEVDIAPVTGTITLSAGTGTGSKAGGVLPVIDGRTTAVDAILNWSGTAATIDANSTISVTGTIRLWGRVHS